VDGSGHTFLELKRYFTSGGDGKLLVVWPARSHKTRQGISLGEEVWVAISGLELVVPLVLLYFPRVTTPFPNLVGNNWAYVYSTKDIRVVLKAEHVPILNEELVLRAQEGLEDLDTTWGSPR
jgi:hypothetical protein